MKRLACIIFALFMLLSLCACGSSAKEEPAAADAAGQTVETNSKTELSEDTDAPEESETVEPAVSPEPAVPAGIPVSGQFFTVYFPEYWEGQFITEEHEYSGRYSFDVFHTASREAEGGGFLFSLELWPDTLFVMLPHYRALGLLSDGSETLNLIAQFPTDVQAATGQFEAYGALYNQEAFQQIFDSLQPAAGWAREEMDETALYNLQSRYEYGNELYSFKFLNRLPDGGEIFPEDWFGSIEDNRFAVCDVDGDGREELLFSLDNSYVAGMRTMVYCWDESKLKEELCAFPVPTFYEQGWVQDFASHNQTFGEAWPYTLLRYNPETQEYDVVASVYSWDRSMSETDYDGSPFPAAVDADGSGTVFCLTEGDTTRWIDDTEYLVWEQERFGSLPEITVPWLAFTDENISSLLS